MCILCGNQTKIFQNNANLKRYHFCETCDLVFLDPNQRLNRLDEKQRYAQHNNNIDDPRYMAYLRRIYEESVKPFTSASKSLDFGCGPSKGLENIMLADGYTAKSYDPIFFDTPSVLKQKYNVITVIEAAEHFYDPVEVFNQLFSMLQSEGVLVVKTHFRPELSKFDTWWYLRDDTHVTLFSKKTMYFIARKYGASIMYENEKDMVVYQKMK